MSTIKAAVHYSPGGKPGDGSACGLPGSRVELTVSLDAVTCGNCMSGLRWRNDMSQRHYKAEYERFYGPGGFLDRAGQTTPTSATTAPQSRAALEKQVADEMAKLARLGSQGAGSDVIARAVRDAVRTVMLGTDHCIRLALADKAEMPSPGTVTFDITDPDDRHVVTQALDDYKTKHEGLVADGHDSGKSTRWAAAARRFRDKAAEA